MRFLLWAGWLVALTACESTAHKAERLRTAAVLACLPPLDSTTAARIRDSVARANPTATDSMFVAPPPTSEAARLAGAANTCDVATREYRAFLSGQ